MSASRALSASAHVKNIASTVATNNGDVDDVVFNMQRRIYPKRAASRVSGTKRVAKLSSQVGAGGRCSLPDANLHSSDAGVIFDQRDTHVVGGVRSGPEISEARGRPAPTSTTTPAGMAGGDQLARLNGSSVVSGGVRDARGLVTKELAGANQGKRRGRSAPGKRLQRRRRSSPASGRPVGKKPGASAMGGAVVAPASVQPFEVFYAPVFTLSGQQLILPLALPLVGGPLVALAPSAAPPNELLVAAASLNPDRLRNAQMMHVVDANALVDSAGGITSPRARLAAARAAAERARAQASDATCSSPISSSPSSSPMRSRSLSPFSLTPFTDNSAGDRRLGTPSPDESSLPGRLEAAPVSNSGPALFASTVQRKRGRSVVAKGSGGPRKRARGVAATAATGRAATGLGVVRRTSSRSPKPMNRLSGRDLLRKTVSRVATPAGQREKGAKGTAASTVHARKADPAKASVVGPAGSARPMMTAVPPVEEQAEYEVEAIEAHKVENGQSMYLIKWKGWSSEYNTWEPESSCVGAQSLIDRCKKDAKATAGTAADGKTTAHARKAVAGKALVLGSVGPGGAMMTAVPAVGEQAEYEVEAIQAHKVENGESMYLVKWKGWSSEYSTWEPASSCVGAQSLIDAFRS